MPIASPEKYAEMLDAAKAGSYAFPAINVTSSQSLNAALQGFAEAGSDGIIQVSTGGAEYASGPTIKHMVTGAVALVFEAAARPLTIEETRALVLRACRPSPPVHEAPRAGVGLLDVARAVDDARRSSTHEERTMTRESQVPSHAEARIIGSPGQPLVEELAAGDQIVRRLPGGRRYALSRATSRFGGPRSGPPSLRSVPGRRKTLRRPDLRRDSAQFQVPCPTHATLPSGSASRSRISTRGTALSGLTGRFSNSSQSALRNDTRSPSCTPPAMA